MRESDAPALGGRRDQDSPICARGAPHELIDQLGAVGAQTNEQCVHALLAPTAARPAQEQEPALSEVDDVIDQGRRRELKRSSARGARQDGLRREVHRPTRVVDLLQLERGAELAGARDRRRFDAAIRSATQLEPGGRIQGQQRDGQEHASKGIPSELRERSTILMEPASVDLRQAVELAGNGGAARNPQ